MDTIKAIKKRRSIRSYKRKSIPKEIIEKLIELANLAPTASNLENRRFIIIQDKATKKRLFEAGRKQDQILEAPVIIAVTADITIHKEKEFFKKNEIWEMDLWGASVKTYKNIKKFMANWRVWKKLWPIQDADAAITTLLLAATARGMATCWIGAFDMEAARKILKLPKKLRVIALVCLGYQKNPPYPQKRKSVKKLITWSKNQARKTSFSKN
jgi:nitroreductase